MKKCLIIFILLVAVMTVIESKVHLGLPVLPSELVLNGNFETVAGDDFDDWTETIPAHVELLTNIDFELVAGDDFTDWTELEIGTGTVEEEGVEVHGGNHSVKITATNGGNWGAIYQQAVTVIGKRYKITCWVKGNYSVSLGDPDFETGYAASWKQVTVYKTATGVATTVWLLTDNTGAYTSYYDDVAFGLATGNIEDTATAHGGTHAVRLTGGSAPTQPYIKQSFAATAQRKNKLSFWSKGDNAVKYSVYDVTHSAYIKQGYGITGDYAETVFIYTVPVGCNDITIQFTVPSGEASELFYIDDVSVLEYAAPTWQEIDDVFAAPAPRWKYGIAGTGPSDLVAGTGIANLTFDNKTGKYSPGHVNAIVGFEEGMPVKIVLDGPTIAPAWSQIADLEEGTFADFDVVAPAWDKEVNEVADFDAETDVDGDLNDSTDATHDGTVGLELAFDNATVMYGTMNADAVDQKSAFISFWFDPNDLALEDGKLIVLMEAYDGTPLPSFGLTLLNNGGTFQLIPFYYSDVPGYVALPAVDITAAYHKINFFWIAATGGGANNGYILLFVDDALVRSGFSHDNDTQDWDYIQFGNNYSNSTTFGGSYYMDTIKIDPVGCPMLDKLAAHTGTYGLSIPVMTAIQRTAYFTDPSAEAAITAECILDLNTLGMANNDSFAFMWLYDETVAGTPGYASLEKIGSDYKIYASILNDALGTTNTAEYIVTDAGHKVRIVWMASSSVGADDGYISLLIDDVLMETLSGIDNDTRSVDRIYFGSVQYHDVGTYGIFYMDDCKWSDQIGQTKFIGIMNKIYPSSGQFDDPVTAVVAYDWMGYANNQELGTQAIVANKRGDEALTTILAEFPKQPEGTAFDAGDQTFLAVFEGDFPTASMARMFQKLARNEQGRIFSKGNGTLVFEAASTRPANTTNAFTLDGTMSDMNVVFDTDKIYNVVDILIKKQTIDAAANQELFTVGGLGIPIAKEATIILTCNFTDADTGQRVAGADVVTPVAAPHFGSTQVPADDDMHANLEDTNYVVGGSSVTVQLHNNHAANTGYLNEFTVLGKRITEYDSITIQATDDDSIYQVGNKRFTERLDLTQDPTTAETLAQSIIDKYAPSHLGKCRIIVLANRTDALAQSLIEAEISTRFEAIESATGISKDFYINNIAYMQDDTLLWVTIEGQEA